MQLLLLGRQLLGGFRPVEALVHRMRFDLGQPILVGRDERLQASQAVGLRQF